MRLLHLFIFAGERVPAPARAMLWLGLVAGFVIPSTVHAQQAHGRGGSAGAATPATPPLTPADSAACVEVINYAFAHTEVMQQAQQFQSNPKAMALLAQPDSVRARIAAAVSKGQGDSLKAMARQVLGADTAPAFDGFIDLVAAFPDSTRKAVATLVSHGRLLNCSQ